MTAKKAVIAKGRHFVTSLSLEHWNALDGPAKLQGIRHVTVERVQWKKRWIVLAIWRTRPNEWQCSIGCCLDYFEAAIKMGLVRPLNEG